MSLHPQDVLVVLKLALDDRGRTYAQLAHELGLSPSQVHAAIRRTEESGLLMPTERKVNRRALVEFLMYGLKYVFPPKRGPVARGMPTAHAAPPLNELFVDGGLPVVWPDPDGDVRGETIEPLHKSVPSAARRDQRLYQCLVLIDAIRAGRARERQIAMKKLEEMILDGP